MSFTLVDVAYRVKRWFVTPVAAGTGESIAEMKCLA